MFDPHPDLTPQVIFGLGWFYLLLSVMNLWWAIRTYRSGREVKTPEFFGGQLVPTASIWAIYSAMLLMVAITHFTGTSNPDTFLMKLPESFKNAINVLSNPISYFTLSVVGFVALVLLRKWLIKPTVGWVLLNLSVIFLAVSMTDWDFRQIVSKPDNVPIVGMLYIVGYFTWLYFQRAVDNDERIEAGKPLYEETNNEKVLVWPDLVYTELICMVVLTAGLVVWGLVLQAPLEEPASAAKTPNPSKAPWYFLGLQEMLVYFDPWLAGVLFPSVIIVGLMAIPYIDFNKRGNGYYSFKERWFAVSTFLFGFLPLWVALIVMGTFLRGPNWNMFGIYEYWDVHKLEVLDNVDLSDLFWMHWMGTSKPDDILVREAPGILLILAYFMLAPPLLAATVCRRMFHKMGFLRYMVFVNLVLLMLSLPAKMILRWSLNLKYLVAIPEYFFNI